MPYKSVAIWIPILWLIEISGNMSVAEWLNILGVMRMNIQPGDENAYLEGNPIDSYIYGFLIFFGIMILKNRNLSVYDVVKKNKAVLLLLIYSGVSILWSDFPFVSLKRYVKGIGFLIMILIVYTEDNPSEAVKILFRWPAYLLIPISVLLIKYYPHIGVKYSPWSGFPEIVGVTNSKNMLGTMALAFGMFFFWSFSSLKREDNEMNYKKEMCIHILFLYLIFWLLIKSNSITSTVCLVTGIVLYKLSEMEFVKNNLSIVSIIVLAIFPVATMYSEDIQKSFISGVGRDLSLTGRVELWPDLIQLVPNPLIGTGFDSFWLGERLRKLWNIYWWQPNVAHNGFLETYINLGLIGVFLLVMVIIATFMKCKNSMETNNIFGKFGLSVLIVTILYNMTESAFNRFSIIWFIFLMIATEYPGKKENVSL
jgi:O-antigen ligase